MEFPGCGDAKWMSLYVGLTIAYSLLEAWLGKTTKTRSGSLLELVWGLFLALLFVGACVWMKLRKTVNPKGEIK